MNRYAERDSQKAQQGSRRRSLIVYLLARWKRAADAGERETIFEIARI